MALTQRQQMVKGSIWRAKEDLKLVDYSRTTQNRTYDANYKTVITLKEPVSYYAFPKGTEFLIADKMTQYGPQWAHGTFVPVQIVGTNRAGKLEYKEFWPGIELVSAGAIDSVWALYSPSKGFVRECEGLNYTKGAWGKYEDHEVDSDGIVWTPKYTQSKRKKRSTDIKRMLLNHSGYYDDIDTSDIYYVFDRGGAKVNFPDDLMIQEIDKATKNMINEWSAKEYLDNSFRLKPLTVKYGSAVRQVFKHMEEKNEEIFETLLMFKDEDEDLYPEGDKSKKIEAIKADLKAQKYAKGTVVVKSTYNTIAMAFKNKSDALMFKLQLATDITGKLVDAQTLEDVKA